MKRYITIDGAQKLHTSANGLLGVLGRRTTPLILEITKLEMQGIYMTGWMYFSVQIPH